MTTLPIEAILPMLRQELNSRSNAVLIAPPGAGKTTRIPLALLAESWLAGRRIVMLEPRRLAARAAAYYMAKTLSEQVGETVGYRLKLDTRVGSSTRIEVITEGILTRMLQADPALEDVGIVIFDEFHERSIHADVGLALCLQAQAILRPDLRILVMSATLEAEPVAALLGNAPLIVSEGTAFPVATHYLFRPADKGLEAVIVKKILEALAGDYGDMLVFLPGAGEIRRVEASLKQQNLGEYLSIMPLYGNLPQSAQDRAIAPSRAGYRKIVLATSLAETSLTVEGVRIVVDSGLMRVPRFSPRTGMTRLETVKVSRASADQRRGRAGRLESGICYRLWTAQEDIRLDLRNTPEILAADLAQLVLELAAWGTTNPAEFLWLDTPPAAAIAQARELLYQLGALDEAGAITAHGRNMTAAGLQPRLAHMILKARLLGLGSLACELAVVLSARDLFSNSATAFDADLRSRIEVLRQAEREGTGLLQDRQAVKRIILELKYLRRIFMIQPDSAVSVDSCGLLLAFAYPDRIAQQRIPGRFLLRNGRGAALEKQLLSQAPYLVAAELDDQGSESRIFLAAPVTEMELRQHFNEQMVETKLIIWDKGTHSVRSREQELLGALCLTDRPLADIDSDDALQGLLAGIRAEGLDILPWTKSARQLQQRMEFAHHLEAKWPDVSAEKLLTTIDDWLAPYIHGITSRADLQRINLVTILEGLLTWEQRNELAELAPVHLQVPSGQRILIDYTDPACPVLSVRLQEMFGLSETPRIGQGRVALTLHLLSPAQRPVQVTQDLSSFWRSTYFAVKKDLMGRYPKHYWPEDPLIAQPTHRVRSRM